MSERVRLRPAHTPERLAEIYATPHDHTRWEDHLVRVATTAAFARACAGRVGRAADLSCGDGTILWAVDAEEHMFGDLAPGYPITGPIEQTIDQIPPVDVFVCCETLEHVDDPDLVLKAIRAKTRGLVLSTPVDAWGDDNLEHYWAWSRAGVEGMLTAAGFQPRVYAELDFRSAGGVYSFGVWWAA
jgi:hypothetical protein